MSAQEHDGKIGAVEEDNVFAALHNLEQHQEYLYGAAANWVRVPIDARAKPIEKTLKYASTVFRNSVGVFMHRSDWDYDEKAQCLVGLLKMSDSDHAERFNALVPTGKFEAAEIDYGELVTDIEVDLYNHIEHEEILTKLTDLYTDHLGEKVDKLQKTVLETKRGKKFNLAQKFIPSAKETFFVAAGIALGSLATYYLSKNEN